MKLRSHKKRALWLIKLLSQGVNPGISATEHLFETSVIDFMTQNLLIYLKRLFLITNCCQPIGLIIIALGKFMSVLENGSYHLDSRYVLL